MDGPLISVIVPVYKVELYLDHCVESIVSQTYQNLEIVLVDDGSPDNCPALCDQWAEKDSRIRVIHKENGGLSDARNAANAVVNGAYVTYVDSDDWISKTYIETLYKAVQFENADIAVCNYKKTKKVFEEKNTKNKYDIQVLSPTEAMKQMLYQKKFSNSANCMLYKKEIVQNNLFPYGRLYEDLFTTYKMLFEARRVAYINRELYFYRTNLDSIMTQKFTPSMFDELNAVDEINVFVGENCPEILSAALSRKFSAYSQVLRWTRNAPNTTEIQEKKQEIWVFLKTYRWKMMKDKNARMKNRLGALLTLLGMNGYIHI